MLRIFENFRDHKFYNHFPINYFFFNKDSEILKIRHTSSVVWVIMRLAIILFAIYPKTRFLTNFQTISTFDKQSVKKVRNKNQYNSKNIRPVAFKFSRVTSWYPRCAKTGGGDPRGRASSCPNPRVSRGLTLIRTRKVKNQSGRKWSKIKKVKSSGGLESVLERGQHDSC